VVTFFSLLSAGLTGAVVWLALLVSRKSALLANLEQQAERATSKARVLETLYINLGKELDDLTAYSAHLETELASSLGNDPDVIASAFTRLLQKHKGHR